MSGVSFFNQRLDQYKQVQKTWWGNTWQRDVVMSIGTQWIQLDACIIVQNMRWIMWYLCVFYNWWKEYHIIYRVEWDTRLMTVPSLIRMYGSITKSMVVIFHYHHQAGKQEVLFLPTCWGVTRRGHWLAVHVCLHMRGGVRVVAPPIHRRTRGQHAGVGGCLAGL